MAELHIAQTSHSPGVVSDERHYDTGSRTEQPGLTHQKLLLNGAKALARLALAGVVVSIVLIAAAVRVVTFGLVIISGVTRSLLR